MHYNDEERKKQEEKIEREDNVKNLIKFLQITKNGPDLLTKEQRIGIVTKTRDFIKKFYRVKVNKINRKLEELDAIEDEERIEKLQSKKNKLKKEKKEKKVGLKALIENQDIKTNATKMYFSILKFIKEDEKLYSDVMSVMEAGIEFVLEDQLKDHLQYAGSSYNRAYLLELEKRALAFTESGDIKATVKILEKLWKDGEKRESYLDANDSIVNILKGVYEKGKQN